MAAPNNGRLARRLRGFWRMPIADKLAIAPVWAAIGLASAAIGVLSFARIAPAFGESLGAVGLAPLADSRQTARARFVQRTVLRAAALAPFRADCLPQALVAVTLCRWLGVATATHLGVDIASPAGGAAMKAHAWVEAGPVRVTGGRGVGRYAIVACFLAADRLR